jgi:hypothetical protein
MKSILLRYFPNNSSGSAYVLQRRWDSRFCRRRRSRASSCGVVSIICAHVQRFLDVPRVRWYGQILNATVQKPWFSTILWVATYPHSMPRHIWAYLGVSARIWTECARGTANSRASDGVIFCSESHSVDLIDSLHYQLDAVSLTSPKERSGSRQNAPHKNTWLSWSATNLQLRRSLVAQTLSLRVATDKAT